VIQQPGQPTTPLAFERHYSVQEIAEMWNISANTARRIFRGQPGVIEIGADETRYARPHKVLRIPESVVLKLHGAGKTL
jgi:hypothetical protein